MYVRWMLRMATAGMLLGLVAIGWAAQRFHAVKLKTGECRDRAEAAARAAASRTAFGAPSVNHWDLNTPLQLRPTPRILSPKEVHPERLRGALKDRGIRLLPYPFNHVFCFASDCDLCKVKDFVRYHEILNHRFGLDVGDSVHLFAASPDGLGLFSEASLIFQGRALVPYYHRGWIDVLHGFTKSNPDAAALLPPGTILKPAARHEVIPHPTATRNTYGPSEAPLTSGLPVHALVAAFQVKDLQADLVLVGPKNKRHYLAINRPLEGRPGWEIATPDATLDTVVACDQEQNAGEGDRIRTLADIAAVGLENSSRGEAPIHRLAALSVSRETILAAVELASRHFNIAFNVFTDHNCTYFFGSDKRIVHEPYTMGDVPQSYVYVTDYLLHRGGLEFINPAVWTSERRDLELVALATPTGLRDGYQAYLARRQFYPELARESSTDWSWNHVVPRVVEHFLEKTAAGKSTAFVYYTHLGFGDASRPDPYGKPFLAAAGELSNRAYNLRGDVPPSQRIWVTRPSTLYKYVQMLHGIAPNVEVDGNRITIRRWRDAVLSKVFPDASGARELHGLTLYVPDSAGARVWLDNEEITCFKRNPPDETGRESVTLLDDSAPTVVFDEVDFPYRHTDMTNDPIGWDHDILRIDPGLEYYLRQGSAPRGTIYGELVLTTNGTATMTVDTPWLDGRDTYYFRFKYKKSSPDGLFSFAFKTEDGRWHAAGEGELADPSEMGWPIPARKDQAWHDCVLDHADQRPKTSEVSKTSEVCEGTARKTLPQQKIVALRFRVRGKAKDRFFFDQIELLRPSAVPDDPLRRRVLAGVVEPPRGGVPVTIGYYRGGRQTSATCLTDPQGYFHFPGIPRGSTVEVTARNLGRVFLPCEGRYVELYANQAGLRLPITPANFNFDPKLRVPKGESANQEFGATIKPRSELVSIGLAKAPQCFQVTHHINNLGFFDRDRRAENPDGNFRILMAGTCLLEGQQVNLGERANMQLERILLERTGEYCEVANFSFSSMSTSAFLPYYEKLGRKFGPSVVIMSFSQGGELVTNCWELEQKRGGYDPQHPPGHVFIAGKDGRLASLVADPNFAAFMTAPALQPGDDGYNVFGGVNWLKVLCRKDRQYPRPVQDAIHRYVAILKHYRDLLAKDNARLLFVLTTEIELKNFSPEWIEDGVTYGTKYYADNVRAVFAEAGVPLLVLSEHFKQERNSQSAHWTHDTHFSRAGHRWCAEAIADFLIANKWIRKERSM
jgi:hypothetical protein